MTASEQALRQALADLLRGSAKDFAGRELVCTPYDGHYGRAGWVVCVNGSPPRGTLVFTHDLGSLGWTFYLLQDKSRRVDNSAERVSVLRRFWEEHLKGAKEAFVLKGASPEAK